MAMPIQLRRLALAAAVAGLWATLCLPAAARATRYEGEVVAVSDGDSLRVRPAGGGRPRVLRLQGIDAPEICQAHGPQAREALRARVLGRRVTVQASGQDAYGRWLARVADEEQADLGAWMVAQGHAWSWQPRGGRLAALQSQARAARRGLWAHPQPLEPRAFRQAHGPCH